MHKHLVEYSYRVWSHTDCCCSSKCSVTLCDKGLKMPGCAIFTCKNRSSTSNMRREGITYHTFPKEEFYRKIWISSCNNHPSWQPTRTSTICSRHFEPSLIKNCANNKRRLKEGAIPTLYLTDPKIKLEKDAIKSEDEQDPLAEASPESKRVHIHLLVNRSSRPEDITPMERKLMRRIRSQTIKIKSLQSKVRYYRSKVKNLEDALRHSTENYHFVPNDVEE